MADLPDWQRTVSAFADVLMDTPVINAIGQSTLYDVSRFTSLTLQFLSPASGNGGTVTIAWRDPSGAFVQNDVLSIPAGGIGSNLPDVQVPVRASNMFIQTNMQQQQTFRLFGSARDVPGLIWMGYDDTVIYTTGTVAMGANARVQMTPTLIQQQGLCQVSVSLNVTTTTGLLLARGTDVLGTVGDVVLAEPGEFHTAGGGQRVTKQVILPAGPFTLQWFNFTAVASANVTAAIVALGH